MRNPVSVNNTSATQTEFAKSQPEIMFQLVLVIMLFLSSLIGNLGVCILLIRYKSLRTIPNLFLANLSIVHLLNTIINLPLLILDNVIMSKEFGGKTASWVTVLLYVTFIILNVYSMVIMMFERYVAISFGMTYKAWTSKSKAYIATTVVWVLAVVVSLATLLSVINIDLGDKPVHIYRAEYFKKAVRYSFLINVVLSIAGIIILSLLTFRSIKLQNLQISSSNIVSRDNNVKRLHNQSTAIKNIVIITIAYALCFVPGIVFTAVTNDITKHHWRNFIIPLCVFFSCVIDPVVFISRSQTLMRALKNIFKTSEILSQDGLPLSTMRNRMLNSEFAPRYNIAMQRSSIVELRGSREPKEMSLQGPLEVENLK